MQSENEALVLKAWNYIKYRDIDGLKSIVPSKVNPNSKISDKSTDVKFLTHAASAFGSLECLKYLVEKGANLEYETPYHYTVVHWAAYGGWVDILNFLVEKKVLIPKEALHIASARGHLNIVKYLVEKQGFENYLSEKADFDWTPLHFAVSYGHKQIAMYLVEKGASKTQKDKLERSPEVLATEYNRNWDFK